MSVLAQIASWIPDRMIDNFTKKHKIQTQAFNMGRAQHRRQKVATKMHMATWGIYQTSVVLGTYVYKISGRAKMGGKYSVPTHAFQHHPVSLRLGCIVFFRSLF